MPLYWLLLACTPKESVDTTPSTVTDADTDTDTDTDADTDTDTDTDTDADTDTTTLPMPEDPTPFTIQVSGAWSGSLTFDEYGCTWYDGIPNFRQTWRNSNDDHVFVLIADIRGPFTGPGTYDETMPTTSVKLQEEAGGSGYYFATDTAAGDTVSITVDQASEVQSSGSFSFSSLHDLDGGAVLVGVQPLPIWCPTMN